MKRPTLTLKEQNALQPVQPVTQAPNPHPKQPSYKELEAKAYEMGLVKLEEHSGDWRRLRRSAGFVD